MRNRFFTIKNEESEILAVIQHDGRDDNFDTLLMNSIADHYNSEDVAIDNGFILSEYSGKEMKNSATIYTEEGDFKIDLKINETALYK